MGVKFSSNKKEMIILTKFTIGISIFIIIYALIMSEKVNRMSASFLGVGMIFILNVLSEEEALSHIDSDTLILLFSMMLIVNIIKRTGVFEYIAIYIAKKSNGSGIKIMILFSLFTAISSAFLDNVTTILLVAPVTIVIAKQMKINPALLIIPEVMLANIGGTATLIGDPPNIMIGSSANLEFTDFLYNTAPVVIIISFITLLLFSYIYKDNLKTSNEDFQDILLLDESVTIKDRVLLIKSIVILFLTILGFLFGHHLKMNSSVIAFIGASILLFISKIDVDDIMKNIEWSTLFFFTFLFILVGALEEIGAIKILAKALLDITKGNIYFTAIVILWCSAIASSFLGNIPFVATMIPLIHNISINIPNTDISALWWAVALGACLGGNGTIIGASANIIACSALEKQRHKISFIEFMKIGFPTMILSIIIATIYISIRYF